MNIFYGVLFCAAGVFFTALAVIAPKWFTDYWRGKGHKRWTFRVCVGAAGVLLAAYGIATLAGWL